MRKLILSLICSFLVFLAYSQPGNAEHLKLLLQQESQDTVRVDILAKLGTFYRNEKPELALTYCQEGLELSRKIKYLRGEATCLNAIGHIYRLTGNMPAGLKYHFQALQISEELNDQLCIALSYHGISGNYEDQGDYKESLVYAYKVKAIAETIQNTNELITIQSNMGRSYAGLGQLDSALKYEQNAYELSLNSDESTKAIIAGRLGNIHAMMGNNELALSFYRIGIPIAMASRNNNALTETLMGISNLFQKHGQYDSSIGYARKALDAGYEIANPADIADASTLLFSIYQQKNNKDSAYKYLQIAALTKDTLFTQDKLKQIQLLAFEEKSRQKEIDNEATRAREQRTRNIQYAAISIGIISFLVLFLLLSGSFIVNEGWIKFFGIVALLIVFEFINLIIHPYLAHATHDSPILMLLALVAIAAILVPLHHKMEKFVTQKMVEKNKRIRLAAAKKTIASLENDQPLETT